ncbi:MAG: four helix bundle protein [Candidatus Omnitrophica bacterium]|nr:four helix bundle protein [Candidatus Omnitrophota bacterium]
MSKSYDLETRTLEFAKEIINLCKKIKQDAINCKLINQLVAASGSVGANYREGNEKLSKKDFIYRLKITRKECEENTYWLELIKEANLKLSEEINIIIKESKELRNIFTSIIEKTK